MRAFLLSSCLVLALGSAYFSSGARADEFDVEVESLPFPDNGETADTEHGPAVEALREHMRATLTYNFSFPLPPLESLLPEGTSVVRLDNLFYQDVKASLREAAYEGEGADRHLRDFSAEQRASIKEEAIFVTSFPGQPHVKDVWKVVGWILRGQKDIRVKLEQTSKGAIRQVVIGIPEELLSKHGAIRSGLRHIVYGVGGMIDSLQGLATFKRQRSSAEVAQLVEAARREHLAQAAARLKADAGNTFVPDLRLFNSDLKRRVDLRLAELERENQKEVARNTPIWKAQTEQGMNRSPSLPEEIRNVRIRELLLLRAQEMFFARIENDAALEALDSEPGLAKLISASGRAHQNIALNELAFGLARAEKRLAIVEKIKQTHRLRGRYPDWVEERAEEEMARTYAQDRGEAYEKMARALAKAGQLQEAFLLGETLKFLSGPAKEMKRRWEKPWVAAQKFEIQLPILPWDWRDEVRKEKVVTEKDDETGEERFYYHARKFYPNLVVSSAVPNWRELVFIARWFEIQHQMAHKILYDQLFNSRFGWRPLFAKGPYYRRWTVDLNTGEWEPVASSITSTPRSYYRGQVEKVARDREVFCSSEGGINKKIGRPFQWFFSDFGKGMVLPAGRWILQLGAALGNTGLASLESVISVGLAPVAAFFSPTGGHFWRSAIEDVGIRGVLQTTLGAVFTVGVLPYAAMRVADAKAWSAVQLVSDWVGRRFLFNLYKIPASDPSDGLRRIQGVGVSNETFWGMDPEAAMVSVLVQMESHSLNAYEKWVNGHIDARVSEFEAVPAAINRAELGLKVSVDRNSEGYRLLGETTRRDKENLARFIEERKKRLEPFLHLPAAAKKPIKFTREQLESLVTRVAATAAKIYPRQVFPWMTAEEIVAFWAENKKLKVGDWIGLARFLIASALGNESIIPIETTDETFRLEVRSDASLAEFIRTVLSHNGAGVDQDALTPTWRVTPPRPVLPTTYPEVSAAQMCLDPLEKLGRQLLAKAGE